MSIVTLPKGGRNAVPEDLVLRHDDHGIDLLPEDRPIVTLIRAGPIVTDAR
jgi:hypothetical protein